MVLVMTVRVKQLEVAYVVLAALGSLDDMMDVPPCLLRDPLTAFGTAPFLPIP